MTLRASTFTRAFTPYPTPGSQISLFFAHLPSYPYNGGGRCCSDCGYPRGRHSAAHGATRYPRGAGTHALTAPAQHPRRPPPQVFCELTCSWMPQFALSDAWGCLQFVHAEGTSQFTRLCWCTKALHPRRLCVHYLLAKNNGAPSTFTAKLSYINKGRYEVRQLHGPPQARALAHGA